VLQTEPLTDGVHLVDKNSKSNSSSLYPYM